MQVLGSEESHDHLCVLAPSPKTPAAVMYHCFRTTRTHVSPAATALTKHFRTLFSTFKISVYKGRFWWLIGAEPEQIIASKLQVGTYADLFILRQKFSSAEEILTPSFCSQLNLCSELLNHWKVAVLWFPSLSAMSTVHVFISLSAVACALFQAMQCGKLPCKVLQ